MEMKNICILLGDQSCEVQLGNDPEEGQGCQLGNDPEEGQGRRSII